MPSANGVSPLAPDLIIQLRLFLHDGARWGWYYPLEKLESPVLDLLNARYVLAGPKAVDRVRAVPRFRHVASLPGNELFENLTVMPRFFIVHQVRAVSSLAEARAVIDRREIDFRQTALTEAPIPLPPGSTGADEVQVLDYEPNSIELAVRSRGAGLLVASETHYPGWEAWVDERPADDPPRRHRAARNGGSRWRASRPHGVPADDSMGIAGDFGRDSGCFSRFSLAVLARRTAKADG